MTLLELIITSAAHKEIYPWHPYPSVQPRPHLFQIHHFACQIPQSFSFSVSSVCWYSSSLQTIVKSTVRYGLLPGGGGGYECISVDYTGS